MTGFRAESLDQWMASRQAIERKFISVLAQVIIVNILFYFTLNFVFYNNVRNICSRFSLTRSLVVSLTRFL